MYRAHYLSPIVPSFDLNGTASFLVEHLGFTITREDLAYRILDKDGLTVHLLPAAPDIGDMSFYLEVDDLDAVWHHLQHHLTGIRFRAPFEQPYGMREIHLILPHTKTLLLIGQPRRYQPK